MRPGRHYLNCQMMRRPNHLRYWTPRPRDRCRLGRHHYSHRLGHHWDPGHRLDFGAAGLRPPQPPPARTRRFVILRYLLPLPLQHQHQPDPLPPDLQHRQRPARRQRVRQHQGLDRQTQGLQRDWEQRATTWQE